MRCLLQKVSQAKVEVGGKVIGEIGKGVLILVCAMRGDGQGNGEQLAKKVVNLRVCAGVDRRVHRRYATIGSECLRR